LPKKDQNARVNQDRVRQTGDEMYRLIDEQSTLLDGATKNTPG